VLADSGARAEVERLAPAALVEHGDGFAVSSSYGVVAIPEETAVATEALLIADRRMYAHKNSGRPTARRQSTDACCAPSPNAIRVSRATWGAWHTSQAPSAATWVSKARRSNTCWWPPSCTTSAR
jgi:GGDEF domain-containing protein